MYHLSFYVPDSHVEKVKLAMFQAGGGRIGNYDCCAWQVKGTGQFRPMQGSSPFIGKQGEVEQLDEYKVEMVVKEGLIQGVIDAMKSSHPYEEPAYHVLRIEPL